MFFLPVFVDVFYVDLLITITKNIYFNDSVCKYVPPKYKTLLTNVKHYLQTYKSKNENETYSRL